MLYCFHLVYHWFLCCNYFYMGVSHAFFSFSFFFTHFCTLYSHASIQNYRLHSHMALSRCSRICRFVHSTHFFINFFSHRGALILWYKRCTNIFSRIFFISSSRMHPFIFSYSILFQNVQFYHHEKQPISRCPFPNHDDA